MSYEKTPFSAPLEKADFNTLPALQEIKGNPEKIIRTENIEKQHKYLDQKYAKYRSRRINASREDYRYDKAMEERREDELKNVPKSEVIRQTANGVKKIFDELQSYGIEVPVQIIVGEDKENEPLLYLITDKIHGQESNLSMIDKDSYEVEELNHLKESLSKLYVALIRYFADHLENDEIFLNSIAYNRQYVYGHKRGEKEKKIYMIDVGIDEGDHVSIGHREAFNCLIDLYREIRRTERMLGFKIPEVDQEVRKVEKQTEEEIIGYY